MPLLVRQHDVEAAVRAAVLRLFGENAIDRIVVRSPEDQPSDDALYVTIFLKTARAKVPESRQTDTIAAIAEALQGIEVTNFPFVTFLAPGYEHASEDTQHSL